MVEVLGVSHSDEWLEPCVGTGALLYALNRAGVKSRRITGLDLHPRVQSSDKLANVERGVEFLRWAQRTDKRFDKIVANPPYIAIERLQKTIRRTACQIDTIGGLKVTAGSNTWYAFLCAAINLLKPGGSLCFVLPAAWDFANYAAPMRACIPKYFDRVKIFRSVTPLFHAAGIQDGSVILLAKGFYSSPLGRAQIARIECAGLRDLISAISAEVTPTPNSSHEVGSAEFRKLPGCGLGNGIQPERLGNLISVRLGGVTGDVKYFVMTEEERRSHELPIGSMRPVLTRAKHLTESVVTRETWIALRDAGERVWLFDPPDTLLKHRAVARYLAGGKKNGACNLQATKIAFRNPWYRTPLPSQIDGFLSGMSRHGPWISLCRMSRLTATNTLYVINFKSADNEDRRTAIALSLLTSRVAEQLESVGRRYADGLLKFEPSDLCELHVEVPSKQAGIQIAYKQCIAALRAGQYESVRRIADAWCSNPVQRERTFAIA
jgi:SAM-dependent methyltransferase